MPLDGQAYLIAQGWSGKGSGLRTGAISRPLAIPQKRTLAGLGKDRDEAFPFWDHVFSAASQSIQIKVYNDNESDASDGPDSAPVGFKRTSTGILSTRRPHLGTPATSGTTTPSADVERSLTLVATAKRQAARAGLYSRFFRGPVLCSEVQVKEMTTEPVPSPSSITLDDLATVLVPRRDGTPGAKSGKKKRIREGMKADDSLQPNENLSGSVSCSTEEARKARKAEKKQKKHEKAARQTALSSSNKPKSKKRKVDAVNDGSPGEANPNSLPKRKKRSKDEAGEVDEGGHESVGSISPGSAEEMVLKARRKEEKEKRRAAREVRRAARRAKEGKS